MAFHMKKAFQRMADDMVATVLRWNGPDCRVKNSFREFKSGQRKNRMRNERRCYKCGHYGHISPGCFEERRAQWRKTNEMNKQIAFSREELENFYSQIIKSEVEVADFQNESTDECKTIKTFLRIKPSQNAECFKWKQSSTGKALNLFSKDGSPTRQYSCDYIFDPDESNENVFVQVEPLLNMAMQGINTCVVAYGGSGSGKSHTMVGNENEQGIIPKTVDYFLKNGKQRMKRFGVQLSTFEIYNERPIDLLRKCKRLVPNTSKDLTKTRLKSAQDFQRYFEFAKRWRKKATTLRNPESSRSH